MKNLITIFAGIVLLLSACKKDEPVYVPSSIINVVNMAVGAPAVKVNQGSTSIFVWSKETNTVGYGASRIYNAFTGSTNLIGVNAADTTQTVFNLGVNVQERANTLYMFGQSPTIETLYVEEKDFPIIQRDAPNPDNSMYVRFVNLSPGSPALSVNVQNTGTSEVTDLAYKGISPFKKYAAGDTTPSYVFEVRDVATNTVRATFTLPVSLSTNRFKTISLVIKGLLTDPVTTGTNAFGVSQVSYN